MIEVPQRIFVLENPVAKNGHIGNGQLQDLINFTGLKQDRIHTSRDPVETGGALSEELEPTDLLYVIGGDGTVNMATEALMDTKAIVLPTRSGNANDLARALNGNLAPWQVYQEAFMNGALRSVEVRPIQVEIEDMQGRVHDLSLAMNYVSFGFAALASEYLNRPWESQLIYELYKNMSPKVQALMRLPSEARQLARAARDINPFEVVIGDTRFETVDLSFVHSSKMAKFGNFAINHTDDFMLSSMLSEKGVGAMAGQFVRMMFKAMSVEQTAGAEFCVSSGADNQQLFYQVDGEAHALPKTSIVSVSLADKFIRALSTNMTS